ncbi:hypothetical protein ABNC92_11525 [Paenibacillus larvae]
MSAIFLMDEHLGIEFPCLEKDWADYTEEERSDILLYWEQVRGTIPEQIKRLEKKIVRKQLQLYEEENFEISCRLNSDIAELASTINDLHIWFRLNQEIEPKVHG